MSQAQDSKKAGVFAWHRADSQDFPLSPFPCGKGSAIQTLC